VLWRNRVTDGKRQPEGSLTFAQSNLRTGLPSRSSLAGLLFLPKVKPNAIKRIQASDSPPAKVATRIQTLRVTKKCRIEIRIAPSPPLLFRPMSKILLNLFKSLKSSLEPINTGLAN
jgi:hypothetical protein